MSKKTSKSNTIRVISAAEMEQVGGGLTVKAHAGKIGVKAGQSVKPAATVGTVLGAL